MANAVGLVGLEVRAVRELDVTSLGADPKIGRSGIQLDEDLCTMREYENPKLLSEAVRTLTTNRHVRSILWCSEDL